MTKYLLTDWEINGYDDSDFMCTYYDDVADVIGAHCYGTTRAAAPTMIGISTDGTTSVVVGGETLIMPTKEAVEKARRKLADYFFGRLELYEQRKVNDPDVSDLTQGLKVKLKVQVRNQVKVTKPCPKCNGSGKWTNPRNENDQRECFSCKGMGEWKVGRAKDENGKQKYEILPVGLEGVVVSWGSFGTFYRNGYNKPNPDNTTVKFRTEDGKVRQTQLKNLRLARECASTKELRKRADEMSYSYSFSSIYPRHAWDTYNHAALVAKGK